MYRFSDSVERYYCYRAVINETGEILLSEGTLKDFYHVVMSHMKTDVHYNDGYTFRTCTIEFCSVISYQQGNYIHEEFTSLNTLCFLFVSTLHSSCERWN